MAELKDWAYCRKEVFLGSSISSTRELSKLCRTYKPGNTQFFEYGISALKDWNKAVLVKKFSLVLLFKFFTKQLRLQRSKIQC